RREHALLHLAGIVRPADQDDLAGEIDGDDVLRTHAVTFGIGAEAWEVDDGQLGHKARKLGRLRADEERADEKRMPGELGEDAGVDAEAWISAAVEVLREQRHALGVPEEIPIQRLELLRGDRLVAGPPH